MPTTVSIEKKTAKNYRALPEGVAYQLINEKLIVSASAKRIYQQLAGRIFSLILAHCDKNSIRSVPQV